MDYKKMFDKLVEPVGIEGICRIIIRQVCPTYFGLHDDVTCLTGKAGKCTGCWAKALEQEAD
jgi:hypothetical protein